MLVLELKGALTALALVVCLLLAAATRDLGFPGQALLQSIRFHVAVVLLVLIVALLFLGAWRRAILLFLVLAVSVGQGALIILRQQEARQAITAQPTKPLLTLLSFNILETNLSGGGRIAEYVVKSGADVVFLMEAGPIEPYLQLLEGTYPYHLGCDQHCDSLMLSKTPLTDGTVLSLSRIWPNRLLAARTMIGGQPVTLVNAHVVKPYFDNFAKEEVEALDRALKRADGPLVLAGDFNAAAWSQNIDGLLTRQKLAPGPGYPGTWPVELGPLAVPIDNVFTRGPLVVSDVRSLDEAMGSNHRGLIAKIALAPSPPATPRPPPAAPPAQP